MKLKYLRPPQEPNVFAPNDAITVSAYVIYKCDQYLEMIFPIRFDLGFNLVYDITILDIMPKSIVNL